MDMIHLPVEIPLNDFLYLPACEAQRARTVCRHVQTVIDQYAGAYQRHTRVMAAERSKLFVNEFDISISPMVSPIIATPGFTACSRLQYRFHGTACI